ncbi:MAG: LLM class flavin-dependent oxidoreductase [Acidimicrobiia bacterium]
MRIGIQLGMHGHSGDDPLPAPGWHNMRRQIEAAEAVGFDLVVVEDALVDGGLNAYGYWEGMTLAGAVAGVTSRIGIGHSVVNPPLRSPAVAQAASTLDEISGGRYVLGIGAGNTPRDYETFGIPGDHRYSRAAEAIEIIHSLLKTGTADVDGRFHTVHGSLVARGPQPGGPPIIIGARGPKMMRLAANFADVWNAWSPDPQTLDSFRPLVEDLARACDEVGRDPDTIGRSIDVAVDPHHLLGEDPTWITEFLVAGSARQIADELLAFGGLGIDEVRCMVWPDRPADLKPQVVEVLADVVEMVHSG